MQKLFVIVFLFFPGFSASAQSDSIVAQNASVSAENDSIEARIVLIGDAGKLNFGRHPVVDAARKYIPFDKKTTILFLGDNLYKTNLPEEFLPDYKEAKAVIDSQINIAQDTDTKVIFIPGNHDWTDGSGTGIENVKRQQAYINNIGNENILYVPQDGCPGPVEYKINDDILLVLYDSQWFIQKGEKPGIESDCDYKTPEQFYAELEDIIDDNPQKLIVLASHHTLKSYGIHGGYFNLKQYFFPFTDLNPKLWIPIPLLGAAYPIARAVFGTPEDLKYPAYNNMINRIEGITKTHKNIIYVAGHEHNLQLIKDSSSYYIVSGAGAKSTRVSSNKKLLYGAESLGFATLKFSRNKNVHVDFYTVNKDTVVSHPFSLFNYSFVKDVSDSTKIPEAIPTRHFEDSVRVAVNPRYNQISGFHKLISGKNYRKAWAEPVNLKVFDIEKEMGGFKIKELGGGRQTKSLKLIDKQGREWSLRTVDKDPEGAVPEALKGTIAQSIVQDMISAQAPYGALIVPALSEAANVVHTNPKYFFVPDDPAFGPYRQVFANKVCMLEITIPVEGVTDTKSTTKVIDKMVNDSKNHMDQEAVLRARLIDMVIGDWDRHFDQWKFATTDTGAGKLYYPLPKDRDQAFFNSEGLLAKAVSLAALPYLQGFKRNYPDIKWFNWEERDFDRIFMNNLDGNKWKRMIWQLQEDINDEVVDNAVKRLPKEIYALHGPVIAEKLKSRRDLLTTKGMVYYRFLAREVNVVGSNKSEFFRVSNWKDSLEVTVYKRKEHTDSSSLMYHRIFDRKDTKFINFYGLNGDDIFYVDSNVSSKIKLRIIGGQGNDTFNIKGNIGNKIYDYSPGNNVILQGRRTKNEMSASPYVNRYDITSFRYNSYRIPMLNLGYNVEDKVLVGLGYSLKTYAFRKEPYATYQKLSTLFSFRSKAYQVKYTGEFNQLLHNNDLVINAQFYNPVLNNFYGIGNNTVNDKTKHMEFYHVRYKFVDADLLVRKKYFKNLLQFYFGPSFYNYWNRFGDNKGKILANPLLSGVDSASVFTRKTYLGGKLAVVVNNLNNDLMPTRGVVWTTQFSSMFGMKENSHQLTKITSDFELYSSLRDPAKLVAVVRFGGGHIFNRDYEYFQALTLGNNNYLRGFRKNRFSGQSLMYQSTELRVKLFESKSYIVPGAVGLIGFYEIGRVWSDNDASRKWHRDFGGGFYYSPYNFAIVSATIAHSAEENLFNFSIGTKFNITF